MLLFWLFHAVHVGLIVHVNLVVDFVFVYSCCSGYFVLHMFLLFMLLMFSLLCLLFLTFYFLVVLLFLPDCSRSSWGQNLPKYLILCSYSSPAKNINNVIISAVKRLAYDSCYDFVSKINVLREDGK